jgi:uncharacterized protein (TIGR02266 family)
MGARGGHEKGTKSFVARVGATTSAGATVKRESESRKYPRISSDFPVIFKLGETTARIHSVNMGGGGLRLETSALPCGAELLVRFRTSKHQAFIQTKARVIYTLPDLGSGVEFTDIDQKHLQLILKAIHGNAGNRRKAPRVPLATQIHIDDSMTLAYSRDLSVGGLFIDTKEPSKIGTGVDLRFRLSENDPVIIAKGEVRYVVPKLGMGVQFTEISDEDRRRVTTFVLSSGEILPEPIPEGSPS